MTRTLALASLLLAPSAAFAGPGAFSDADFLLQLDTVRAVVASAAAEPEAASWDGVPMIAAADAGPVDPAGPAGPVQARRAPKSNITTTARPTTNVNRE